MLAYGQQQRQDNVQSSTYVCRIVWPFDPVTVPFPFTDGGIMKRRISFRLFLEAGMPGIAEARTSTLLTGDRQERGMLPQSASLFFAGKEALRAFKG